MCGREWIGHLTPRPPSPGLARSHPQRKASTHTGPRPARVHRHAGHDARDDDHRPLRGAPRRRRHPPVRRHLALRHPARLRKPLPHLGGAQGGRQDAEARQPVREERETGQAAEPAHVHLPAAADVGHVHHEPRRGSGRRHRLLRLLHHVRAGAWLVRRCRRRVGRRQRARSAFCGQGARCHRLLVPLLGGRPALGLGPGLLPRPEGRLQHRLLCRRRDGRLRHRHPRPVTLRQPQSIHLPTSAERNPNAKPARCASCAMAAPPLVQSPPSGSTKTSELEAPITIP